MQHVIVGSGPAALSAATTLRRLAPRDPVVMIAREAEPFYSRVLVSYYVAGKLPYERMFLTTSQRLQEQHIEVLAGRQAVLVDPAAREVALADGQKLPYDRLLLATGGTPHLPPIEGAKLPGVFALWTIDDATALSQWIREGQRALVVGAGPVGLKAAEALMTRGLAVTVVEKLDRVMPQLLAPEDAAVVRKALETRGLPIRTGVGVGQIAGEGRVQRAALSDGTDLECDVVVMATGVRPNLAVAKSAGAAVGSGILVDQFMQTTVPAIYAAGDVAEGWDLVRGTRLPTPTWGNASEQGRVAAHNMAGRARPFAGAIPMNSFTFLDFAMAAVGITQPEADCCRVHLHSDPHTGEYRKLVTLGERLVGAVAIGDLRMVGVWRGLIGRRLADAPVATALLPGRTTFAAAHCPLL